MQTEKTQTSLSDESFCCWHILSRDGKGSRGKEKGSRQTAQGHRLV